MLRDAHDKYAFVPIVLRFALAVIFIYHGLAKVTGPDSSWGAAWANVRWRQEDKLPANVQAKFNQLVLEAKARAAKEPAGTKAKAEAKEGEEQESQLFNEKSIRAVEGEMSHLYAVEGVGPQAGLQLNAAAQLAVAWGELAAGIAILLGFVTRLACVLMIIIQVGAIATVTGGRGFSTLGTVGYEYNFALLAMLLALILAGAGLWSFDHHLWVRRRQRQAVTGATTPAAPAATM
jgi:putative oxidoreductase